MLELIMYVGVSGSGKSAYVLPEGVVKISSDEMRRELYGDECDQTHNAELFIKLAKHVHQNLRANKSVCIDATNLNAKRRRNFLKQFAQYDCYKSCYIFATPIGTCIARDASRFRTVGKQVIMRQVSHFELPDYSEGWDNIQIIHNVPIAMREDLEKIHEKYRNMPHNNPYHKEGIFEHMQAARAIADNYQIELRNVAYWHDVGKYFTGKIDNEKGYTRYFNHHNYSTYLYITSQQYENLFTAWAIQHHMENCVRDAVGYERWKNHQPADWIELLEKFNWIDRQASRQ